METEEYPDYYDAYVWDYIEPFAAQSGTISEEDQRAKIEKIRQNIMGQIEKQKRSPPDCILVRVYNPDGTPFTSPPSTSKATGAAGGSQDSTEKQDAEKRKLIDKHKFFKNDSGECYDILMTPKNYTGAKQEHLRHMYRILFWLDFITKGFNCDKEYLKYF